MDFAWWKQWIPGYEEPHRSRSEVFGKVSDEQLRKTVEDISALSLISKDDPPIFMSYGMSPKTQCQQTPPEHGGGRSIT